MCTNAEETVFYDAVVDNLSLNIIIISFSFVSMKHGIVNDVISN